MFDLASETETGNVNDPSMNDPSMNDPSMNDPSMNEEELDRDPTRWVELFGDELFGYAASRVSNTATAEDLVQETLLSAIKSLDSFGAQSKIKTWIFGILRNKLKDHYKAAQRDKKHSQLSQATSEEMELASLLRPAITNQAFGSRIEKDEFRASLLECQAELPPHLAEAFRLKSYSSTKSTLEISKDLDISESNLSVRLFRARLLLRKCLERIWLGIK